MRARAHTHIKAHTLKFFKIRYKKRQQHALSVWISFQCLVNSLAEKLMALTQGSALD